MFIFSPCFSIFILSNLLPLHAIVNIAYGIEIQLLIEIKCLLPALRSHRIKDKITANFILAHGLSAYAYDNISLLYLYIQLIWTFCQIARTDEMSDTCVKLITLIKLLETIPKYPMFHNYSIFSVYFMYSYNKQGYSLFWSSFSTTEADLYNLRSGIVISPALFLFLKSVLTAWKLSHSHINFRVIFFLEISFYEEWDEILIGITLNL